VTVCFHVHAISKAVVRATCKDYQELQRTWPAPPPLPPPDLHFSNWGSRRPITNWSTSTMNLSPALAFPPIGSRSRRCSIIDRTKSSSSSCALRANACTVGGSTVGYGRNDEEDEVEDAIERTRSLGRWLFEGNRERFHRKVAEASRRASFIEDRLTKQKSEANH
jgi:hypothetical protein